MNTLTNAPVKQEVFESQNGWGLSAMIDLYECDPSAISSPDVIRKFVVDLCDAIGMKRHGEVLLDRFGDGVTVSEGYSFMQFIETSSITAHFEEPQKKAFIDIFSCKFFEAEKAAEFCKNYFKAENFNLHTLIRN